MALAVLRGCKFIKKPQRGLVEYFPILMNPLWNDALDDVAEALDYANQGDYNDACADDTREVRRRIRAL